MKFLLPFVFLALAHAAQAALVSKVVGTVADKVVTSREVQLNYILERALSGSGSGQVPSDVDSEAFRKEISQVLLEWMVYLEAQAFALADIGSEERRVAEDKLTILLKNNESLSSTWKNLAPTSAERDQLLLRKLRAKKFIRFKTDSSFVTVTDREALSYFQKNRVKFGSLPFEKFKESIKTFLSQQQADERLKEWFRILQKKYQVRHLGA
ncbi:MAG TPA: hypothetical protein VFV50_00250 [Bdellovibrionales bacterium]|nr:hypothetical protein [Bdellovibrionales bacterium]